jgi:hypothetical protein
LLLAIGAIAALVVGWQVVAFAGPVGNASGFEDDDGNLVDNTGNSFIDWNAQPNVEQDNQRVGLHWSRGCPGHQ